MSKNLWRILLLLVFFAASRFGFYRFDLNLIIACCLGLAYFRVISSQVLIAGMNVALLFTDYSYQDFLKKIGPTYTAPSVFNRMVVLQILLFSFIFGWIYLLNNCSRRTKQVSLALLFSIFLAVVLLNFSIKTDLLAVLMVLISPYFYNSLAMIYMQFDERKWTPLEICCNLTTFFTLGTLPIPLLITEHVGAQSTANETERSVGLLRAIALLLVARLGITAVFENQNLPFFRYLALSVMPYSSHPPQTGFYNFEIFSWPMRIALLMSAHAFFLINIGTLVYWKVIVLRFFHIELPAQINFPWREKSFYGFLSNLIYHDNQVFVRLFLEPLARTFKSFFIRHTCFATSLFLFFTLIVYHILNNQQGAIAYTSTQLANAYGSLVLYSALLSFGVYLSLKLERRKHGTSIHWLKLAIYFVAYALMGYVARDHYLVPLSEKAKIFSPVSTSDLQP